MIRPWGCHESNAIGLDPCRGRSVGLSCQTSPYELFRSWQFKHGRKICKTVRSYLYRIRHTRIKSSYHVAQVVQSAVAWRGYVQCIVACHLHVRCCAVLDWAVTNTALQTAVKHSYLENFRLLLSTRADPTIRGGNYGSPLKAAPAKDKHYHVASFLRRYMTSSP